MSEGWSYRYYARLTPGDEVPSVWCGDIDGPNVYKLCEHRTMLVARVHAFWRNLRRPPTTRGQIQREDADAEADAREGQYTAWEIIAGGDR